MSKEKSSTSTKLAPCPFCGGRKKIKLKIDPWLLDLGEDFPKYFVMCENCGCKTARFVKDQAVSRWNKRSKAMNVYDTKNV